MTIKRDNFLISTMSKVFAILHTCGMKHFTNLSYNRAQHNTMGRHSCCIGTMSTKAPNFFFQCPVSKRERRYAASSTS